VISRCSDAEAAARWLVDNSQLAPNRTETEFWVWDIHTAARCANCGEGEWTIHDRGITAKW